MARIVAGEMEFQPSLEEFSKIQWITASGGFVEDEPYRFNPLLRNSLRFKQLLEKAIEIVKSRFQPSLEEFSKILGGWDDPYPGTSGSFNPLLRNSLRFKIRAQGAQIFFHYVFQPSLEEFSKIQKHYAFYCCRCFKEVSTLS